MGKALPFSSIDQYLKNLQAPVHGCLVDTQFLIAATEELLCREYLSGQLIQSWNVLVEDLNLNYLDMRGDNVSDLIPGKLDWEKMYAISETTALSSGDSMLVNVLHCSKFPFIVSADFDIAYSLLADPSDKTVLIPDNLHYKKVKGLRF